MGVFWGITPMMKLETLQINPEMLELISEIDEFRGSWRVSKHLSSEQLAVLQKNTMIESVGSSNRIEGYKISDKEVEDLLARIKAKSFQSHDEEEIAGYASVLEQIFQNYETLAVTEEYIKQMHDMLLQFSSKICYRGHYKKFSNQIKTFDYTGGNLGFVLETPNPFETPKLMHQLFSWLQKNLTERDLHPLLTIGIFIIRFLTIHPFQDQNGRLSRLLTTWLLLKSGYSYVAFSSIETIIEANKENYYAALRHTHLSFKKGLPDWHPWLKFFLSVLKKQKDELVQKIEREKILVHRLNPLAAKIIEFVKSHRQLSISEIQTLTNANRNTLKVQLRELVKNGYLHLCGAGRNTWYVVVNT